MKYYNFFIASSIFFITLVSCSKDKENTIIDLINEIKSITSSESKIEYFDLPENDPKIRKPDITRAKVLLNWEPKVDLTEGLIKTIKYFEDLRMNKFSL